MKTRPKTISITPVEAVEIGLDHPLGDAVDQLENDFDAFFEFLNQPGANGEKTTDPAPDLFSEPTPPAPASTPAASIDIPQATGWHVAALQFVSPIGTWRMACQTVNQGTRHANVTFHPAPARAGYRANLPGATA